MRHILADDPGVDLPATSDRFGLDSQTASFARRLRRMWLPALIIILLALASGMMAFGPLIAIPTFFIVAAFGVMAFAIDRTHDLKWPLILTLVFTQLMLVAVMAVAVRFQLDLLGVLILPAVGACLLFAGWEIVGAVLGTVALMIVGALLVDPARVADQPPVLILPIGVLLCVALPAAAVRQLEIDTRLNAQLDNLTGALNRAALDSRVAELDNQAQTLPLRMAVIMGDLDHFKSVNDDLGHDAGDIVLREAVQRMRSVLGPLTPVYRVGGEEFLVMIAGADERAVADVAEQLRYAISEQPIVGRPVTMSFGVAAATLDVHRANEIVEIADAALYVAKRAGRDQVRGAGLPETDVEAQPVEPDPILRSSTRATDRRYAAPDADAMAIAGEWPTRATVLEATGEGVDAGNFLVRGDSEREHMRALAHALSRTHHAALGFVFLALIACIPWLGWHLMVPAAFAVPVYHLTERNLQKAHRPEYTLAGAWLLVQLGIFFGALIADPGEPYMLILFVPMMIGVTAVFPLRGGAWLAATTIVLVVVGGAFARPDLVRAYPGLLAPPILVILGITILCGVTGGSAIRHRARAVVDSLTGLLTRGALRSRLREVSAEEGGAHGAISLVAFDVDHFKSINDTRGHAAGDIVLREIGQVVRENTRALEWCFRLGGDEFVIVVPEGSVATMALAERLRTIVANLELEGTRLTASFGVATCAPEEPFDFDAVYRRADVALYEAKSAGRNRVALAPAIPALGPPPAFGPAGGGQPVSPPLNASRITPAASSSSAGPTSNR